MNNPIDTTTVANKSNETNKIASESEIYRQLIDHYDSSEKPISLDVYKKAVDVAKKADQIELHYILYCLNSFYGTKESKTDKSAPDKILYHIESLVEFFVKKEDRANFVIDVINTAMSKK